MCDINLKNISTQIENTLKLNINYIDKYSFSLNNTFDFFNRRILDKNIDIQTELHNLFYIIQNSLTPINTYIYISSIIYNNIKHKLIDVDLNYKEYDYSSIKLIWLIREIFISLTFYTIYTIYICSLNSTQIMINNKYRNIDCNNIIVNIFGSNTFKSDIDITITGRNTSDTIAIFEDLIESVEWFDNGKWKVDIYGDFMLVGGYYIDTHNLSNKVLIEMIRLVLIGYFRHSNSAEFDNTILLYLIDYLIYKYKLDLDLKDLFIDISNTLENTDFKNRETYYKFLKEAEILESETVKYIKKSQICNGELYDFFGEIIIKLGNANLYRSENYILTPTIVQIVKLEQTDLENTNNIELCNSVLTNIAKCSISEYSKILCAIEQLGYLQYYLLQYNSTCNLKANKYFGRFLRSIKDVKDLKMHKILLNQMLQFTFEQEETRKVKNDSGLDNNCTINVDLYNICCDILKLPKAQK